MPANDRRRGSSPALLLTYAPRSLRPRHSFFSVLSLLMAGVTVAWLLGVQFDRPRYHQGGPLWQAFWENAVWPGGIGLALAVVGLMQSGRKQTMSVVAIVVIVLAYVLWSPSMSFA